MAVEQGLVERCQAGDEAAWDELFAAIVDDVHRIIAGLTASDPDHDDLCQEALLAVHRGLGRFRGDSRFETWLYGICVNLVAAQRRRRFRRRQPLPEPEGEAPSPEGQAISSQELSHAQAVLHAMKPKKRAVYVLYDLEGLPAEEVARIVGTSVATVHTRLHHARLELRQALARLRKEAGRV